MVFSELKNITSDAPLRGHCLGYTRYNVFYMRYDDLNEIKNKLDDVEMLELHMFDMQKEYRALSSGSKRFENGIIEHTITDELYQNATNNAEDLKYGFYDVDTITDSVGNANNDSLPEKIKVRNYYQFNEDGILTIIDYRLISEE